jgi:2,3-bisphosphoglycerate-independent phosphoglycerate mutase
VTTKAYIVALCGAGDRPIAALGGRTALEAAAIPNLDRLACRGRMGLVDVVGDSVAPESDSGAMALLGYDPLLHYTGRGALEGLGIGFLDPEDGAGCACFRINFASYDEAQGRLDRRTARDLTPGEQAELVEELRAGVRLAGHPGVMFELTGFGRHRGILCFRCPDRELSGNVTNTDPGFRRVGAFGIYNERFPPQPQACRPLDGSAGAALTAELVEAFSAEARRLMNESAVNARRIGEGRLPANLLLLRDGGHRPPALQPFAGRFGLSLSMYGQIPSEHGLCRLLGGTWRESVPPETGLDEYYRDLAGDLLADPAAVVFVHVKGPDEPAHDGKAREKVEALAQIDRELIGSLAEGLRAGDVLVVTCDHATPCDLGIHSDDRVPLLMAGDGVGQDRTAVFSEAQAALGDIGITRACELMDRIAPALRT